MRRLKLSTKITWNYALIFTSILLIINLAVFFSTQLYNRLSANNEVEQLAESLEERLLSGEALSREMFLEEGILYPLYAEAESGGVLLKSEDLLTLTNREEWFIERTLGEKQISSDDLVIEELRVAAPSGIVTLRVVKDLSVYHFMNSVTLVTLIIASLLGILVSYVVGYFMSRQSFQPILAMTKSAAAIGPSNLHDRIEVPEVKDELKELSETFNGLLDRIDDAYSKQAQFVSDASHELRTPLTVIKGYNDLLNRWGKEDPEILSEAIEAIRLETDNMSMLVENLLFIAKGENRKMKLSPGAFSVKELLTETAKDFSLSVPSRVFQVDAEEFVVTQDRRMIKQLLRIFLENSVKFTKEGSTITLRAKEMGDRYCLQVEDQGEGIAKEDLKNVFERFYVGEKARTKDKAGSGLGLSIAKWIVDTHGGTVQAKSTLGKGTTMEVELPKIMQI
ncbi:sensor histidine kinase [Proteiniclasticum ruminis]|uniref:sensor histidine kinase n=1 Tax=Proteiniclasticum ruminis TaxID=398199 RepID=UPI00289B2550|nr:ATP-binding protein [Proteiniclasticum ruminis]